MRACHTTESTQWLGTEQARAALPQRKVTVADRRRPRAFLLPAAAQPALQVTAGAAIDEVFMFASASLVLSASMLVQLLIAQSSLE